MRVTLQNRNVSIYHKDSGSEEWLLASRGRLRGMLSPSEVMTPFREKYGGYYLFGEMYPGREMKTLYSVQYWFRYNWPLYWEITGAESDADYLIRHRYTRPFFSEEQLADVAEKAQGVLEFAKGLTDKYPGTIVGFVTDDEPPLGGPAKAAVDLVEEHTGFPATTIHPSYAGFRSWAPYMNPIGGDWYVTVRAFRRSWDIASRLRWFNENHPASVFWFMPLLTRYEQHDRTLPGLKDSLTSPTELRLQIWQAVALGCKGMWGWSQGGHISFAFGSFSSPLNFLLRPTTLLWEELNSLSETIVPIGPLLLSCQSDTTIPVKVSCGRVRYPEFQGPALDYGLLRDMQAYQSCAFRTSTPLIIGSYASSASSGIPKSISILPSCGR